MEAGMMTWRTRLPAARAERLRGLDERGIDLAHGVRDDEHLLEKGADEDDGDLRPVIDAENGHAERAKGRRGQVAEKLDERLLQPREKTIGAAENPERHAQRCEERRKPQKMVRMLCPRLSCSHGSFGRRGSVVKAV